jgi:hypothetical protein
LPQTLIWDRQAGIHGHEGRPSEEFAAFCGQLRLGWQFFRRRDPQAKGAVERLQGFLETELLGEDDLHRGASDRLRHEGQRTRAVSPEPQPDRRAVVSRCSPS